jgi:hypothetical protein
VHHNIVSIDLVSGKSRRIAAIRDGGEIGDSKKKTRDKVRLLYIPDQTCLSMGGSWSAFGQWDLVATVDRTAFYVLTSRSVFLITTKSAEGQGQGQPKLSTILECLVRFKGNAFCHPSVLVAVAREQLLVNWSAKHQSPHTVHFDCRRRRETKVDTRFERGARLPNGHLVFVTHRKCDGVTFMNIGICDKYIATPSVPKKAKVKRKVSFWYFFALCRSTCRCLRVF